MVINQGDVFWISIKEPTGSEPGFRRPYVIIQNNVFNHSRIHTVVTCALTSTLKRAHGDGNVLLRKAEANLPKRSVVNVSQIVTVDKSVLTEKIGTLGRNRVAQILRGVFMVLEPREVHPS